MKVTVKDGNLVIEMPLGDTRPSKSGKTLIVAGTGGFKSTEAKVDGKTVMLSLNATIPVAA